MGNKNWIARLFAQQIFTDHRLCTWHDSGARLVNTIDMVPAFVGHADVEKGAIWWLAGWDVFYLPYLRFSMHLNYLPVLGNWEIKT